jgi:hypothetical protein
MSFYNGQRCVFAASHHVFDEQFLICECGQRSKKICRCTDCGTSHEILIDTPESEILHHRVWRLESRMAELEQPPAIQGQSVATENVVQ